MKHVAASGLIAGGVTAAMESEGRDQAFAAGIAGAMAAGAGKEWYDLTVKKACWSWKDLVWDFVGASAGATIALQITE